MSTLASWPLQTVPYCPMGISQRSSKVLWTFQTMPFPHGYAEDALYNAVNLCVHAVNNLRYALSLIFGHNTPSSIKWRFETCFLKTGIQKTHFRKIIASPSNKSSNFPAFPCRFFSIFSPFRFRSPSARFHRSITIEESCSISPDSRSSDIVGSFVSLSERK